MPKKIRHKMPKIIIEHPLIEKPIVEVQEPLNIYIFTRILFYIDIKHFDKYSISFNNDIMNTFYLINKSEMTHPLNDRFGISLFINKTIKIEIFKNIIDYIMKYFNDYTIIFKYKTYRENTLGKGWTFDNIKIL